MSNNPSQKIFSLIGEIQGPIAKFELVFSSISSSKPSRLRSVLYQTANYPSIRECLAEFLAEYKDTTKWPSYAILAVAGAPYEDTVVIPGCHWPEINTTELSVEFGIESFKLINDFVAVGNAILELSANDVTTVQGGDKVEGGTAIVIGCSQTLGECTLRSNRKPDGSYAYQIFESQGGLKKFSPTTASEWEYYQYVMDQTPEYEDEYGYLPLEKAFCGDAITKIYNYICKQDNVNPKVLVPGQIITQGLLKKDTICEKVIDFATRLLGTEVSNFAVDTLPVGGIYLVGGYTKMLKKYLLKDSDNSFLTAYQSKGSQVNETLSKFPIYIVDRDDMVVSGAYIELKKMLLA